LNNLILDSTQPPAANRDSSESASRRGITMLQYGLTFRDVARIQALLPEASVSMGHLVKQKVFSGSQRVDARVLGVDPSYSRCFIRRSWPAGC